MADATVRGNIIDRNQAEFTCQVSCENSEPSGTIRGTITVFSRGREIDYSFRSSRATRVVTTRLFNNRSVFVIFSNATVRNLNTGITTTGATITLLVRRRASGRRTATLTIRRPRRTALIASGIFRGIISIFREVSCRRRRVFSD